MEDEEMTTGFIINAGSISFSKSVSIAVDEDMKNRSHTEWNPDDRTISWSVDIDENSETMRFLRQISESLNNIYEWMQYKRYVIFFKIR